MMRRVYSNKKQPWSFVITLIAIVLIAVYLIQMQTDLPQYSFSLSDIPEFSGEPYVVLYDNQPQFTEEDITVDSYEYYSPLDSLERCGYAMACIGRDLMPTEDRESISSVKPSGWVQAQYDFVDGGNLYNRCHLIGFQLAGENANERNLITGTRYCNVNGMLPFENMVADYVQETGNHVLYRITPVFLEEELVARGVQMEAWSVEDSGEGICFHVYVYNVQPGVVIDYATGGSYPEGEAQTTVAAQTDGSTYILNTSSRKFHREDCAQGQSIKDKNKAFFTGNREELIEEGYTESKCCDP